MRSNGGLLLVSPTIIGNFARGFSFSGATTQNSMWAVSIYFVSDHLKTMPIKLFLLYEKFDEELDMYTVHKFYLENDNVMHDIYHKQSIEIDKNFRELLFGTPQYLHHFKPRWYATTRYIGSNKGDEELKLLGKSFQNVHIYSDFLYVVRNISSFGYVLTSGWQGLSQPANELSVYDLLLFDSTEELVRVRRNSIDVDINLSELDPLYNDEQSLMDKVSTLF